MGVPQCPVPLRALRMLGASLPWDASASFLVRRHLLSFPSGGIFFGLVQPSTEATILTPGRIRKWLFAEGRGEKP